ncbi:unnamed protein product [Phytomonas sp. Hart1]|nr:unnamed protein product [Phytomonas sp. Hart1]|eukprot:CCW67807.1 unnamed protein product [Phytomonas sp. isolate Hart1]
MEFFNNNNPREDAVFTSKVKWVLLRGDNGVRALREFYARDAAARQAGREGLNYDDFAAFLADGGVRLSAFELDYLCRSFDDGKNGLIAPARFVGHLTGMNYRRARAVERAWEGLAKDESGHVRCANLVETLRRVQEKRWDESSGAGSNAGPNPMAASYDSTFLGTATSTSRGSGAGGGKDHFARSFGGVIAMDGASTERNQGLIDSLSKGEFVGFYSGISQCIHTDETFEVAVLQDWEADDACRPTLNETARDWGDGGDPLADHGPRYVRDALNMTLGIPTASYNYSPMKRIHPYVEPLPPLNREDLMRTTCNLNYGFYTKNEYRSADPLATRRGQSM